MDNYELNEYASWDEEDNWGLEDYDCSFPDKCLMPGLHFRNECHTVEMIEPKKTEELILEVVEKKIESIEGSKILQNELKEDYLNFLKGLRRYL